MSDLALQPPYLLGFKESVQAQPRDTVVPLLGNLAVGINKVNSLKLTVSDQPVDNAFRDFQLRRDFVHSQPI